jgi:cell division protein FtsW
MAQTLKTDRILFVSTMAMVSFGLVILYSASSINAQVDPRYNSAWYFVIRQFGWAVASIIAMMTLKKMHYRKMYNPSVAFIAMGLALLMLVAVYFIDSAHHRWLRLPGSLAVVGVQPSELAKPALVIFLAYFLTWKARAINNRRYTLAPAAIAVGFLIGAVVKADLGTAVVLGAAAAASFFVAGLEIRYCMIAAALAMVGVLASIAAEPYRLARVVKFVDPQLKLVSRIDKSGRVKAQIEKSIATHDTNYQLEQSKIAVGEGGPIGVGLMNGVQKLRYLPEAHTDFIYAVVGEELGLVGALALLLGFGAIFWRGLRATWRMNDDFGRYLALGATVTIVVQGLMNMSVVLGMMPTKGIPLPMISYGGSSLLSTMALLGMLMNVSEHAG